MGGIGKTELAKQYAEQYKAHYDTIAFGRFNDSLDNLFKSSDFISIENDSGGTMNLDSVRGLVDNRTLLIIDNFDNDSDPRLDAVLSLKCRLLFTSRNSFEQLLGNDAAFTHYKTEELALYEQVTLFEHECGRTLDDDDRGIVRLILEEIRGYTLLIPLIAKTYKNDVFTLSEIHQRIDAAGAKGASGANVRHHKDLPLSSDLYGILCEVLSVASLSDDEVLVMRSLAMLGGIVIDRKEFNTWLGGQSKNAVNSLAENSLIQIHGTGEKAKLSLHKVLSEVVRNELKPEVIYTRRKHAEEHVLNCLFNVEDDAEEFRTLEEIQRNYFMSFKRCNSLEKLDIELST